MSFKASFFLLWLIALVVGRCQAAPQTLEVLSTPNVPSAVRASIPLSGRTWFYGKVPAELKQGVAWIHFYSVATSRHAPTGSEAQETFNPRDYVLSIWQRRGTARSTRFRLLNSVKLSGDEFLKDILIEKDARYLKFKTDVLWLRDSTRQTPIIRLNVEIGNGVNAFTASADVLFTFTNGLQKVPHVQQFVNFFEYERGATHSYDQMDEQGILVIIEQNSIFSSVADTLRTQTKFLWNGRKFVAEIPPTPSQ